MKVRPLIAALMALAALSGCSMMTEDEDTSNCGLFVTFKYDYNLQRSDMFADHVGGVTLYVFDSDGRFVRSYDDNDTPAMGRMLHGEYVHCMQIMDLPDGQYRLVALAHQKSYDATLLTPGAKYRRSALSVGDAAGQLTVTLDRQDAPTPSAAPWHGASRAAASGAEPRYVSAEAPLDTLWHAMSGAEPIVVDNSGQTIAQLSLVRDTKMLTVSLHNLDADKRASISTDDFDFFITDCNGRLGYNNDLLPDDDLVYTPFHKWNTQVVDAQGHVSEATAHAGLTFNRLIWYEQADRNALLIVRNKATGREVAAINLTDALAQGRNAYDLYAYSRQEYLDRSYDYYLDFFIRGEVWQYAEVRINVLSWTHRIQNVNLR